MIILDRKTKIPLYEQIYRHIRDEISAGELVAGHRLTATRAQAANLGVSRNTVELAYLQLCSEGYLENKPGSGYYVNHINADLIGTDPIDRLQGMHVESDQNRTYSYDLKYGNCHMEEFPLSKWKRAMDRALTEHGKLVESYGSYLGNSKVRMLLAEYLEKSRGVCCRPDQIVVGSGTQYLTAMILQLIQAKTAAIEEPGYDGVRHVLENHGVDPIPIPVTENGIDLQCLRRHKTDVVYVTPSHQFPMGAVMPVQNRMELVRWAQEQSAYIIEDDYDSVFRYTAKAIPAMQGLDKGRSVIYLGGLSKALSPSLRVAYMVLPMELKNKYDMFFSEYHNTVPEIIQQALAIFMEDGMWDRHMRKICLINKRKHDLLYERLEEGLPQHCRVMGKGAGLHLIVESNALSAEEMVFRGEKGGLKVYSMDRYFMRRTARSLIMIGYGGIALQDIEDVAERLIQSLKLS